ncbi:nitrogen fixation protein NifX [Pararhodospirillum oryzae]|uniref:Nitrogen fixation protein NifX n=1 Tax=Pararhodospirillum oryzae TaxID=478448 RepID=A0A512H6H1_9PROT|nr:nitrogen fixation protein NifX [Pararhodospirillum oryzae]
MAFASSDRVTVDQHFGGSEGLVVYDVAPGQADLVGLGTFIKAEWLGESARVGLTGTEHDKVLVKLDFLEGCHAVYAASIGTSSIRRLMMAGIQPIIVDSGHAIIDLLNEVSLALVYGGLSWVDKARARVMASAPPLPPPATTSHRLMASLDDLEDAP